MLPEAMAEAMFAKDKINMLGKEAELAFTNLCKERGMESHYYFVTEENLPKYLEIVDEIWARWRTTNNFKVGDRVYVVPLEDSRRSEFKNCIRAIVTEVGNDEWGYRLRAFRQDLPGIYMYNMWDKELIPRTGKENLSVEIARQIRNGAK